jgi:hypothetical protein
MPDREAAAADRRRPGMTVLGRAAKAADHAGHATGTVSPREQAVLWDLEERFWTEGVEAARATTATEAVMIFPHPPSILQGDQIWGSLRQRTGWRSVALSERRATRCGDIAIVTYRAAAEKPGMQGCEMLCASTYVLDRGTWLRLAHQQTSASDARADGDQRPAPGPTRIRAATP